MAEFSKEYNIPVPDSLVMIKTILACVFFGLFSSLALASQDIIGVWEAEITIDAGGYADRHWGKRYYTFNQDGTFQEHIDYYEDRGFKCPSMITDIEREGTYLFVDNSSEIIVTTKYGHIHRYRMTVEGDKAVLCEEDFDCQKVSRMGSSTIKAKPSPME